MVVKMSKNPNPAVVTALAIAGIMISYIMQMGPSPLLLSLRDEFGLMGQDALLNLCVSVIFPFLIIGSVIGGFLDQRIGTSWLFILAMSLIAVGVIGNFWVTGIIEFLIFRAVFGLGFGFGVPFIGSVIMKWYGPKQRDAMTTMNGLFPFVATLITFCLMLPIARLFGNSWGTAFGFWGILAAVILVIWMLAVHRRIAPDTEATAAAPEKGIYRGLIRRKSIRILAIVFVCDFFCYSYIATILPTWLFELGRVSEMSAGIIAAVAFPLLGLVGCGAGGLYSAKAKLRKTPLVIGQALKLIGLVAASVTVNMPIVVMGVSVYAFGNGLWMPSMYSIPTELKDMSPSRVGAAFTLMSAFGFAFGFLSPIIGGLLTEALAGLSVSALPAHVFGLRWSVFIFGFLNLLSFIFAMRISEPVRERL